MKETFKNNIKVTAVTVVLILAVVFYFLFSAFYGNPIDKRKALNEIENYLSEQYNSTYTVSEIKYDLETENYIAYVTLGDDKKLEIAYNIYKDKIEDSNYISN